jgi:hypothetical protein
MTPREKAKELVNKFIQYTPANEEFEFIYAKKCALIAVDEIIKEVTPKVSLYTYQLQFWQEVKKEIENL